MAKSNNSRHQGSAVEKKTAKLYSSTKDMIVEYLPNGTVKCQDERGFYITKESVIDKDCPDWNRLENRT